MFAIRNILILFPDLSNFFEANPKALMLGKFSIKVSKIVKRDSALNINADVIQFYRFNYYFQVSFKTIFLLNYSFYV